METGLRKYWTDQTKFQDYAKVKREVEYIVNEDYYLHLDDLQGCFIILLVGLSLSFLVFLVELSSKVFKTSWWRNIKNLAARKKRNAISDETKKESNSELNPDDMQFVYIP